MKRLIRGGTIINEGLSFKGSLLINDGKIEKILDSRLLQGRYEEAVARTGQSVTESGGEVIDARGLHILPGIIDDQVHFREPGAEQKGTIESESKAAVLGGVTSFMDMPNNNPAATTIEALEQKFEMASDSSYANYSFYLGATNDNIEQIKRADKSRVCGIKLFMGSSTGNMLVDNPQALERIFAESPILIAAHCEDEEIIKRNLAVYRKKYGEQIPFSAHTYIRSREACVACSKRAIDYALKTGARLHILHISTTEEIEMLKRASKLSPLITGEICVHYLWFTTEESETLGSKIKCNPSIKEQSDRETLRKAVKEGIVKVLATDHAPHTLKEKLQGYLASPSGIPTIQHSLQIMVELVKRGIFTMEEVVNAMCHGPAECFNIAARGFIREGYCADLVLVDLNREYTVAPQNIAYKCKWSPFEGYSFGSSIIHTFVNGRPVVREGQLTGARAAAELRFDR